MMPVITARSPKTAFRRTSAPVVYQWDTQTLLTPAESTSRPVQVAHEKWLPIPFGGGTTHDDEAGAGVRKRKTSAEIAVLNTCAATPRIVSARVAQRGAGRATSSRRQSGRSAAADEGSARLKEDELEQHVQVERRAIVVRLDTESQLR